MCYNTVSRHDGHVYRDHALKSVTDSGAGIYKDYQIKWLQTLAIFMYFEDKVCRGDKLLNWIAFMQQKSPALMYYVIM